MYGAHQNQDRDRIGITKPLLLPDLFRYKLLLEPDLVHKASE